MGSRSWTFYSYSIEWPNIVKGEKTKPIMPLIFVSDAPTHKAGYNVCAFFHIQMVANAIVFKILKHELETSIKCG